MRERNLRVLADMENLRERSAKAAQSTKQYAFRCEAPLEGAMGACQPAWIRIMGMQLYAAESHNGVEVVSVDIP